MISIETKKFGTIEIDEEKVITFPEGLLGFESKKKYVLIQQKDTAPFCLMQSIEDPYLAFFVINPYLFISDYKIEGRGILKRMNWEDDEKYIALYVLVTIPHGEPRNMTANLMGPILINNHNMQAVQLVLQNSPYSHQHRIFNP